MQNDSVLEIISDFRTHVCTQKYPNLRDITFLTSFFWFDLAVLINLLSLIFEYEIFEEHILVKNNKQ